jgi:hypothetical protein
MGIIIRDHATFLALTAHPPHYHPLTTSFACGNPVDILWKTCEYLPLSRLISTINYAEPISYQRYISPSPPGPTNYAPYAYYTPYAPYAYSLIGIFSETISRALGHWGVVAGGLVVNGLMGNGLMGR